jgi:hypothetical protein
MIMVYSSTRFAGLSETGLCVNPGDGKMFFINKQQKRTVLTNVVVAARWHAI